MDTVMISEGFVKGPLNFQEFLNFQKELKALSAFCTKKKTNKNTLWEEVKRKERLKSLFLEYMQVLNITPNSAALAEHSLLSSEIQIKSLLKHQSELISDLHPAFPRLKSSASSNLIYRNPLIFKIKAVLEPESKLFRPTINNFSVKSLFFHEETEALSHKAKLEALINMQLCKIPLSKLNKIQSKETKTDQDSQIIYKKKVNSLKLSKIMQNKKPPSASFKIDLSNVTTRRQRYSEDMQDASNGHSSSATHRRLGFFNL